ncbi:MAG TPA: bifunctional riboflavin kinase/FAD synthetase [Bacteroidales bacterium]|nr:bifunctional riboflavin kinase/FAD synthetase [Bacteroidales bacterium]
MIIHEGYENLNLVTPVVTLGIFDGVHRGHRALLDRLVSRAREVKGNSVVITFSPHPRLVLDHNRVNLSFLTTMEERKVLLEKSNIDHLVIVEFNEKFSKIPACDFIKEVLVKKIGTKQLIIGFNHHFGRSGYGDFNTIVQCAESLEFKVEQVQGFHTEEGAISSSSIREALLKGRIDEANRWLGYSYSISGKIVEGQKIGRAIGFPTANIEPDYKYKLVPANGVYAVEVLLDGKQYHGMLSIGSNPTVNSDNRARSIEVNILDLNGDIYGRTISVVFRKRLRDEVKFDSREQLTEQMKLDRQQVLRLFGLTGI